MRRKKAVETTQDLEGVHTHVNGKKHAASRTPGSEYDGMYDFQIPAKAFVEVPSFGGNPFLRYPGVSFVGTRPPA